MVAAAALNLSLLESYHRRFSLKCSFEMLFNWKLLRRQSFHISFIFLEIYARLRNAAVKKYFVGGIKI